MNRGSFSSVGWCFIKATEDDRAVIVVVQRKISSLYIINATIEPCHSVVYDVACTLLLMAKGNQFIMAWVMWPRCMKVWVIRVIPQQKLKGGKRGKEKKKGAFPLPYLNMFSQGLGHTMYAYVVHWRIMKAYMCVPVLESAAGWQLYVESLSPAGYSWPSKANQISHSAWITIVPLQPSCSLCSRGRILPFIFCISLIAQLYFCNGTLLP